MAFQNLSLLYIAVPVCLLLIVWRFWRRHYWSHPLVTHFGEDITPAHPIWRLPRLLELAALAFLLVAMLGPVYPFTLTRVERGGLQIMFVVDLSQSMEEALQGTSAAILPAQYAATQAMLGTPGTRMEGFKKSALDFVASRSGDAIGLVVFSNNGYLVAPTTFDHESMTQYLLMTGTQTLVNEGYTGIGEGLATANRYFEQQRESSGRQIRGQVILLFTDGENNTGREPMIEIERARKAGTRIYMISIDVNSNSQEQLAFAIPMTGGKFYDVRRRLDLDMALNDINQVEKGVFYTVSLTRNQPAYDIFVLLALACLAVRLSLHALPPFVEIS
jgi:hypothetical protein